MIEGNIVTIGGDIIIAINGTRIANLDDLSTYLEEDTLPGQTINVTVVRGNQTITIAVKLGTRPLPTHRNVARVIHYNLEMIDQESFELPPSILPANILLPEPAAPEGCTPPICSVLKLP